jgi:magnesium chelatase family protein
VLNAHERALARQGKPNDALEPADIDSYCPLDDAVPPLLRAAAERLGWSARAYHRVLKLARTIADLRGADVLGSADVAEAVQLRRSLPG